MYYLCETKKKTIYPSASHTLKDFKEFYEIANYITVPIFGKYVVIIKTDKIKDILDFIALESNYADFIIYIYTNKTVITQVSLRKPLVNVQGGKSEYEVFVELISKYELLFKKGVADLLYRSIEHDFESMDNILSKIKTEYGMYEVTEQMIQSLTVINKLVYPRTICMSYLYLHRWRRQKLTKCVEQMGNDLVFWSIRKTLKKFVKDKSNFLKTGIGPNYIKAIDTNNLIIMYNTFCLNDNKVFDVFMLMNMYERGVSINDFIQDGTFSI